MKNKNGITMVSLTIYVIVAGIVVLMLGFLNANFFSRITELTGQTNVSNQYSRFCSYFVRDLKNSDSVTEYNKNEIKFSNGTTYEIRKLQGDNEAYAIYRDSIKVCENIKGDEIKPYFDYSRPLR